MVLSKTLPTRSGGRIGGSILLSHELADGWTHEELIVSDLTRQQIAQYAGATYDFGRIHIDEPYAVNVFKSPSVVAFGMLHMGMTGRVLTDLFGPASLSRFGGRFISEVHPGDSLRSLIRHDRTQYGAPQLAISVVNSDSPNREVFRGWASLGGSPDPLSEKLSLEDEFEFRVEETNVRAFVRAIGETNPVFSDHSSAVAAGFPGILAPPTFTRAAMTLFHPGRPWTYSAMQRQTSRAAGLHAEQEFEYFQPVFLGDVLTVAATTEETWEKAGRSGQLRFRQRFVTFTNQNGSLASGIARYPSFSVDDY